MSRKVTDVRRREDSAVDKEREADSTRRAVSLRIPRTSLISSTRS